MDRYSLSENINAISVLEKNIDKIDRSRLSCNSNAIFILEQNQDKMYWQKSLIPRCLYFNM